MPTLMRPLLIALVLVSAGFGSVPAAHAAVADNYLPVYATSDGVSVKLGKSQHVRFAAKADRIYRGIRAGRR